MRTRTGHALVKVHAGWGLTAWEFRKNLKRPEQWTSGVLNGGEMGWREYEITIAWLIMLEVLNPLLKQLTNR